MTTTLENEKRPTATNGVKVNPATWAAYSMRIFFDNHPGNVHRRSEFLEKTVGDNLSYCTYEESDLDTRIIVTSKIARETKKQFVLENGERFWKQNSRFVGESNSIRYYLAVTDEFAAAVNAENFQG